VAEGRQRPLPVQRLRTVLQDERHQQAARETKAKNGKRKFLVVVIDIKFKAFYVVLYQNAEC
jgi:hypothetical protein